MKTVSFCTASRNRLWQLRETLSENLHWLDSSAEIVLVDYGSSDGLSEWVWSNFEPAIKNGQLVFFEVGNDVGWNASRAKNLAHRISTGGYLFNLDADNFVTRVDFAHIKEAIRLNLPCHQWTGNWSDGSCGRIGLHRELFSKLGGYDESMLPMGGQDVDLINRMGASGTKVAMLPPPAKEAIQNSKKEKVSEYATEGLEGETIYDTMNQINGALSKMKLRIEGPYRKGGFATFRGTLNGRMIEISGLNRLTDLSPNAHPFDHKVLPI